MTFDPTDHHRVRVERNSAYWRAQIVCPDGRKVGRSLGPVAKFTEAEAHNRAAAALEAFIRADERRRVLEELSRPADDKLTIAAIVRITGPNGLTAKQLSRAIESGRLKAETANRRRIVKRDDVAAIWPDYRIALLTAPNYPAEPLTSTNGGK